MKMKKLLTFALVSALAVSLAACGAKTSEKPEASEQKASTDGSFEPKENVTMIVAYKAGSGTDTTARVLSEYATKTIGKTVVINNLEGGSGSIGWTALSQAKPDGYTLGFINLPTVCSNIVEELGDYTMEDFIPICNHVDETAIVLTSKNSEFNTLKDLVDYAKANPGKLKASTNGEKASNHIGAQLLAKSADFEYTAIPYGGTADQLLALRQGEVQFAVAKVADIASMKSEVKVLGVFSTERIEEFKDVPTLGELGYYDKWYGSCRAIVAPKGTPQEVIDFYAKAFKEAMESPEYIEAAKKANISTLYMNPEETKAMIDEQYKFCVDDVAKLW